MDRDYRGFIFTKHALERLSDRSITQDMVIQALQHPENTHPTGKRATMKFIKTVNGRLLHVVATHLPKDDKWLVVSVWVRGEDDKEPLMWRVITFPFKAVWYVVKKYLLHT